MLFSFDRMFDFDNDGELDSFERAIQFDWLDETEREERRRLGFDDDDDEEY